MDPIDLIVSLVSYGISGVVYAVGFSRVLPSKHRWLLAAILFFTLLFLGTVANQFINGVEALVLMAISYVVAPFVLFEGKASHKVVAIVLSFACQNVASMLSDVVWSATTGMISPEDPVAYSWAMWSTPVQWLVSAVVGWTVLWLLLAGLRRFLLGLDPRADSSRFLLYLAFPVLQIALFVVMALEFAMIDADIVMLGTQLALAVLCLAADILIVLAMERQVGKIRDEERAASLQRQLDEYLEAYAPVSQRIEKAAKLRHDLRNQMQVAIVLAERGQNDRAREHLASFRRECDEGAGDLAFEAEGGRS